MWLSMKREGAAPSDLSCCGGKAIAFVALEAVTSVIGVDLHRRLLRLDRLDVAHRDGRVQLTEMQHGRDSRGLIGHPDDVGAVIAGRSPAPCNCWMPESVCFSMIFGNALGRSLSLFSNSSWCICFTYPSGSRRKPSADKRNIVVVRPPPAGLVLRSRLFVINRTTDNRRLYRDESGGITSAF